MDYLSLFWHCVEYIGEIFVTKPITKEELWNQVKAKFYQEIGPVSFDTYIEPLTPITLTESRIVLEVPAEESADIIDNWNKSYAMSFVQYAMEIAEGFIKPELRVAESLPKSTPIQTENLTFTRESDLNETSRLINLLSALVMRMLTRLRALSLKIPVVFIIRTWFTVGLVWAKPI